MWLRPYKAFSCVPLHLPYPAVTNLTSTDRQGTNTHPNYQRKGLGTLLSLRCNEIADKAGAKTYVVGRPNSLRMLHKTGFRALATDHIDMTKYGGSKEDGKMWILMREPQGKESEAIQDLAKEDGHLPSVISLHEAREEERYRSLVSSDVCLAFWIFNQRHTKSE